VKRKRNLYVFRIAHMFHHGAQLLTTTTSLKSPASSGFVLEVRQRSTRMDVASNAAFTTSGALVDIVDSQCHQ